MSNIAKFEAELEHFDWSIARRELGYVEGQPLNIGWYCTDRICQTGRAGKLAMIWENHAGEVRRFTFDEMRVLTNTFAARLRELGVKPGDRVCVFMDRIPELYIGFLAVLKLGAIVQPLFSAFGDESLFTRLESSGAKVVLTQHKHGLKVRKIRGELPSLETTVIVDAGERTLPEGEVGFDLFAAEKIEAFESFPSTPETPSVLHYTSGTTGQPKGALHVHNSIFSQYLTSNWVLDLHDSDVYWCTADPGWVTGTSYGIIGPWANGATQAILDAGFSADRWYGFIAKHKVTVWYSAPTAIRLLMKEGDDAPKRHDLASLRHLASVGEPLNAEAVLWSQKVLGLPFHDTFWQTETGAMVITNRPGLPIKPGSMGKPFPGIVATVVDPKTHEPFDRPGAVGLIALRPGWPSMFRQYWNKPDIYASKFINGWYLSGDRASIDADGYFWFVGRDDDVINTGGHLVGPFEIESALLEHPAVAESAAIGMPDPVNMEVPKVFIALKPGFEPSDDLELEIMNFCRKHLSPLAMPQAIEFVASLPKNRSGKIMRRVLHAKEWGEEAGDLSTLDDE